MNPKKPTRGQPTNVWLHHNDLEQLDKLRLALAKQHRFASKSQVLRACLHLAKVGEEFFAVFERVLAADARRR